jgi:hypothetical protein
LPALAVEMLDEAMQCIKRFLIGANRDIAIVDVSDTLGTPPALWREKAGPNCPVPVTVESGGPSHALGTPPAAKAASASRTEVGKAATDACLGASDETDSNMPPGGKRPTSI